MQRARAVQAFMCDDPKCPCVHIQLFDSEDNVFAEATLTSDFVKQLQNTLYAIAVEKGD